MNISFRLFGDPIETITDSIRLIRRVSPHPKSTWFWIEAEKPILFQKSHWLPTSWRLGTPTAARRHSDLNQLARMPSDSFGVERVAEEF